MESHNLNTERVESFIGRSLHAHILVVGKTALPHTNVNVFQERPDDSALHLGASFTSAPTKELAPLPEFHCGVGVHANLNFHENNVFPIFKPDAIPLCVDRLTERAERELRLSQKRPQLNANHTNNSPSQETQPAALDQSPFVWAVNLSERTVPVVDRSERIMYVSSHLRHRISQNEQIEAKLVLGAQTVTVNPPDTIEQPLLFSLQQPTTFTDRSERLVKRDWASNSHKLCRSVDHSAGLHNGQRT